MDIGWTTSNLYDTVFFVTKVNLGFGVMEPAQNRNFPSILWIVNHGKRGTFFSQWILIKNLVLMLINQVTMGG